MATPLSRHGHFWSHAPRKVFNEYFLTPFKKGEPFHLLFFSGYFGPNHYHLYQLVQLAQLQQQNPKNTIIHLVLADVGLHTRRHTEYSALTDHDEEHENEIHLLQMKGALAEMGVPESNIRTYYFSDLLVRAFNMRKDILIEFYRGLSEIQNDILEITDSQRKKFKVPEKGRYTIGYVVQKYGILFLAAYFSQIFHQEVDQGKVIPIFGDSGRPIIERLENVLFYHHIIPAIPFSLNLDAIPTFGTDKSKTSSLSIPTAGMSSIDIARVARAYSLTSNDMAEINRKFTTPVLGRAPLDKITIESFSDNLSEALQKLISRQTDSLDLVVSDTAGIERMGALLRSSIVQEILPHCNGSRTITEIARLSGKHTSNVSVVLRQLREAGLLDITSDGKPLRRRRIIKILLNG